MFLKYFNFVTAFSLDFVLGDVNNVIINLYIFLKILLHLFYSYFIPMWTTMVIGNGMYNGTVSKSYLFVHFNGTYIDLTRRN